MHKPDEILKISKEHLNQSLKNKEKSSVPDLGLRWDKYSKWTHAQIDTLQSVEQVIEFAQERHGFELRETGSNLLQSIEQWDKKVCDDFPQYALFFDSWAESAFSSKDTTASYQGRLMGSMLCHLIRFHFSSLAHFAFPQTVCEIGGGYGAPARVWLKSPIFKPSRYIIVDLCESLFFSEVYLRSEFPDARITHLGADDLLAPDASGPDIVLCPLEEIDKLLSTEIDLLINTLSMQEMSEEWIDYYMAFVDRSRANSFYSFNSLGRPLNNMYEVVNLSSPRPSREWVTRSISYPYGTHGDAAEIIYDRTDEPGLILKQRAIETFERALAKGIADRQHYAQAVDSLRFLSDDRAVFKFVEAAMALDPIPREVLHFCGTLTNSDEYDSSEIVQIESWVQRLSAIRASGNEAAVQEFVK